MKAAFKLRKGVQAAAVGLGDGTRYDVGRAFGNADREYLIVTDAQKINALRNLPTIVEEIPVPEEALSQRDKAGAAPPEKDTPAEVSEKVDTTGRKGR